jgi:flagellar biosynthesis/type III secretory pathway protein FliH
MSFLLWQSAALDATDASGVHVASSRRVFAAAEVPLLREANDVLRQIHARAQAQARQLDAACEAARRQGHDEGFTRGLQAAQDEVAQRLASLDRDARVRADELRGQIAVLALAAVQKMLGELPFAPSMVAASAQAARDVLPDQRVTLNVHPSRVAEVRAHLASAHGAASRDVESHDAGPATPTLPAHTEVLPDPLLGTNDGRLETAHGSIQIGLDTQLARLAQAWGVQGTTCLDRSNRQDA